MLNRLLIKERRRELGLSIIDVGKQMGRNKATVYKWETGDIRDMKTSNLYKLAKILQVEPAMLVVIED